MYFQVMSGAAWLELLCRHIPDRYEHLVRYAGWYSNRARGERAKKGRLPAGVTRSSPGEAPATDFAARAKAAWARLIRKVYTVDPLECPQCKGPMRVIALIALVAFLSSDSPIKRVDSGFWLEATAIVAFGVSWLTKGEAILKDE